MAKRILTVGPRPKVSEIRTGPYNTPVYPELDRDSHAAWCRVATPVGTVPSDGVENIRRGIQWPWRVWARRVDECIDAGVELRVMLVPLRVFERWMRWRYLQRAGRSRRPAA